MRLNTTDLRTKVVSAFEFLLSSWVCDWIFCITCAAWVVYRIFCASYYGATLAADNVFTVPFFHHRIMLVLAYCELAKAVRHEYELKDLVALGIAALMAWSSVRLNREAVTCVLLLLIGSRHCSMRRLLTICTLAASIAGLWVLVSAATGTIPDTVIYQGQRVRHCMGFTYALFPSQLLFCVTCVVCVLRGKRLTVLETIPLLVLNAFMYLLTDSRLSFALVILMLVGCVLVNRLGDAASRPRWLWSSLSWSFVIVAVVTIGLGFMFSRYNMADIAVFGKLDSVLSKRLTMAGEALGLYRITPFGQVASWVGNGLNQQGQTVRTSGYFYVDMLFVRALIERGFVYVLCFVGLWTCVAREAYRRHDHTLLIVLAITALHCVVDDLALELHYNLMMLLLFSTLIGRGWRSDSEAKAELVRVGVAGAAVMAISGVAAVLLGLLFVGVIGSPLASASSIAGTHAFAYADGKTLLRLDCDDVGAATIEYHNARLEGTLVLRRSDKESATFELRDTDDTYAMTIVVPRDVAASGYIGAWKVYYPYADAETLDARNRSDIRTTSFIGDEPIVSEITIPYVSDPTRVRELSDYLDVHEDGSLLWMTGSYNILTQSKEKLASHASRGTWRLEDDGLRLEDTPLAVSLW